jgi:hypothetical protein
MGRLANKIAGRRSPYASGAFGDVTFTIGAETGGNTRIVSLQFKNHNGGDVAVRVHGRFYLSDDANGDTYIATAPSGAVTAGTDGHIQDLSGTAKKMFSFVSEADGDLDVSIVEAGAKTLYMNVMMPDGSIKTSSAIAFA